MATEEQTSRQLVVTAVGDTQCGIEIENVHEIILMQEITAVPKSPRNVLGAIDVRGAVLPVVDLRACLGFPPAPHTVDTRIVLVSYEDQKIGLVVDGVAEVITLPIDAFQKLNGNVGQSEFLHDVARLEDRLILHIDHERVIRDGLNAEPTAESPLLSIVEKENAAAEEASEEKEKEAQKMANEETTDSADEGGLNVELLESSFELLAPRGEELVERFYDKLFETAPAVREFFPDDLTEQRKALLGSLGIIVKSLRSPEKLTTYLQKLGASHVKYGAVAAHYDVVAGVLLETMAELAGDVWNDDLQSAWTAALGAVKEIMLSGAEQDAAAA